MVRLFQILIAFLFSGAAVGLVLLVFFVKFNNQSPLGKSLKSKLIKYPAVIKYINLNEPGDAKYIYLDPKRTPIRVNVMTNESYPASMEIETWITDMVAETINKPVLISLTPLSGLKATYTKADLNTVRNEAISDLDQADLRVIYLPLFDDQESYAGLTQHRDTIFIFQQVLDNLADKPADLAQLEQSTLMHEWGHLLGMEHNDFTNCIMSATVEVSERATYKNNLVTDYCWDEIYQFQQMNGI